MPLFFIVLGIGLVVIAVRGKLPDLVEILKDDFTSSNNFIAWLMAFAFIGFVGSFSKDLRPLTNAFSALLIIALLIGNKNFFSEFERQALK